MNTLLHYIKSTYSVIFDQEWYWLHLRPKLEGSAAWLEFLKTGLIVWAFSLAINTILLFICNLLAIRQNWLDVYFNATRTIFIIAVFSFLWGLASRNKWLWSIPTMVTLGTLSSFQLLFAPLLTLPGINMIVVTVFVLLVAFVLAGCLGITFVVARGEGILEMLSAMLKSGWRAMPESKGWSILTGVTLTALVAILVVPLVGIMLYTGWKEGAFVQICFVLLAAFFGMYASEKWAARQVKSVSDRKHLANFVES